MNYNKHQYAIWACKIVPEPSDKMLMVVGDEVDTLYLYDLETRALLAKNKTAHTQGICDIVWMNSGTIMSGSFDGSISLIFINNFAQTLTRIELGGTIWRIINFGNQ